MSDIARFAKMKPGAFKDELNALMAKGPEMSVEKLVALFKENVRHYVKENGTSMTERSVKFPIMGGKIYNTLPETSPSIICTVESLLPVKAAFGKEGIILEWVYDRSELNGKLVFKW